MLRVLNEPAFWYVDILTDRVFCAKFQSKLWVTVHEK